MYKVYGIPNCGTCKKAFSWFKDNGFEFEFIDLKLNPPDEGELTQWAEAIEIKSLKNTSGMAYRAIPSEERDTMEAGDWVKAMAENSMLIKRPVILKDGKAVMAGFRGSDDKIKARLST